VYQELFLSIGKKKSPGTNKRRPLSIIPQYNKEKGPKEESSAIQYKEEEKRVQALDRSWNTLIMKKEGSSPRYTRLVLVSSKRGEEERGGWGEGVRRIAFKPSLEAVYQTR